MHAHVCTRAEHMDVLLHKADAEAYLHTHICSDKPGFRMHAVRVSAGPCMSMSTHFAIKTSLLVPITSEYRHVCVSYTCVPM